MVLISAALCFPPLGRRLVRRAFRSFSAPCPVSPALPGLLRRKPRCFRWGSGCVWLGPGRLWLGSGRLAASGLRASLGWLRATSPPAQLRAAIGPSAAARLHAWMLGRPWFFPRLLARACRPGEPRGWRGAGRRFEKKFEKKQGLNKLTKITLKDCRPEALCAKCTRASL